MIFYQLVHYTLTKDNRNEEEICEQYSMKII